MTAVSTKRTISMHFVAGALRGAQEHGEDVRPVLHAAGIPVTLLHDSRARVTRDQYAQLIRGLWTAFGDEFLLLGDFPCRRGTFAMMCLTVLGCPDLETALRRGFEFYSLFPTRLAFRLEQPDGVARLCLDLGGLPDPDHFVTEALLTIWHRVTAWVIAKAVPPVGIEFGYLPPPHYREYHQLFGCPMTFGHHESALLLDGALLTAPIIADEAGLWARMATAPDDLLRPPHPHTSYRDRVRRILVHGHPPLSEVAGRLAVSPQTLRRHLAAEGTSYRALKEETLRDAAITALASSRQSVEELAAHLGFADASAFHRAFKRWTGTSPGAYRATTCHLTH